MGRLSRNERGEPEIQNEEKRISILVKNVRTKQCESSFLELKIYLDSYIKLFGKKYRIPGCDSDEIEQECLYALRYKAIEDFNPKRGRFKAFAVLCIKRHLFSLIKSGNQQKRIVLNTSLSLNEDRSDDGENVSLASLVTRDKKPLDDHIADREYMQLQQDKLLEQLSPLEREVYKLYVLKYHYDEMVPIIKKKFPKKRCSKKTIDNALSRLKGKSHKIAELFKESDRY